MENDEKNNYIFNAKLVNYSSSRDKENTCTDSRHKIRKI
jgi:hypothetical protein